MSTKTTKARKITAAIEISGIPKTVWRAAGVALYMSLRFHGKTAPATMVAANPVMLSTRRPRVSARNASTNEYSATITRLAIAIAIVALTGLWVWRSTFPNQAGRILSNDIASTTLVPPTMMFGNHIQYQAKNITKEIQTKIGEVETSAAKKPKKGATGSTDSPPS